jgi:N-ethylmaleimide reductase
MSKLFSPIQIGAIDLSHRVVLGPMTRMRSDLPGNVPNDLWRLTTDSAPPREGS